MATTPEEKKPEATPKKYYPLPQTVEDAIKYSDEFLASFITNVYDYKQRRDLRVSNLRIVCSIEEGANVEHLVAKVSLIVEMRNSSETIVLYEKKKATGETSIKSGKFQPEFVKMIQGIYHLLMRHGLATVIRAAQKKEADIIL